MEKAESVIRALLERADVGVDGARPWDLRVHEPRLYQRLLQDGVLGLGEAYMDEWWDCDDLADCICRLLRADLEHAISPLRLLLPVLKAKVVNLQTRRRAARDVSSHYDRGNQLFRQMLDKRMTYSCAYWKDAADLDTAQEDKLDLVCRKAGLREGDRVLDIGCGWGSFMKFAAERYGVSALGVTLSKEQAELGRELCAGLPVEFRLQDYREIEGSFDAVISIGMFEHVGAANHRRFMRLVRRVLKDDGLFVLHTIGTNRRSEKTNPWTERYVFPGGQVPAAAHIASASDNLFVLEDWHNFGVDYARTLDAWFVNFHRSWEGVLDALYDRRFYRMWKYFLLTSSGGFRARRDNLWQVVFSKHGVEGGYVAPR